MQHNNINSSSEEEDDNDIKLEKSFFETNKKSGNFIVICGKRGSGKSWLATNYIAISYFYNMYDSYYFVFPEYENDANDETYKFIKQGQKNTTIYDSYSNELTAKIKEESKTKKILYVLDDATNYLFENKNKPELIKLATTCRHGKGITIIIITHALVNILLPAIRAMINFLFIGAFTNAIMIEKQLWQENCSIMISKDEFLEKYKQFIIKNDNNFFYINGKCQLSFHINEWNLSNFDRNKANKKGPLVEFIKIDKNYNIKKNIEEKNKIKKMEMIYKFKPQKEKVDKGTIIQFNKHRK